MSDDRELLELAAKAAGYDYECTSHTMDEKHDQHQIRCGAGHLVDWNPLVDDGDALRLGTTMHMSIDFFWNFQTIAHITGGVSVSELHNKDPHAATRRAIVRAAAEIGRLL